VTAFAALLAWSFLGFAHADSPPPAVPSPVATSAAYALVAADCTFISNNDADAYFGDTNPWPMEAWPGMRFGLGYQYLRWLALEASVDFGPGRFYSVADAPGGGDRRLSVSWAETVYALTPAITWVNPGSVQFLGLRLGLAEFSGHVDDDASSMDGSYDQSAQAFDLGLLFRSSRILENHISVGIEVGYDFVNFVAIHDGNGSGAYESPQNPERDIDGPGHGGPQTLLGFSGPHLAVVFGLWSNPPVPESPAPGPLEAPH
jgi:hypothetical protein